MRALAVDLYCGLGGWTDGLLATGWSVVGFDIERHAYGDHRYPAQLVLQDVRTLHGRQFKDAQLIVASSPCQAYSYMAMPWTKAKDLARWYREEGHPERLEALNELFLQPARIQREASEAAGRHIPMVQENVRGAVPWVGPARWHYGSYYLWGDVPALMPITNAREYTKVGDVGWRRDGGKPGVSYKGPSKSFGGTAATKNAGGSWFAIGSPGQKETGQNPDGRRISKAWRDKHYDDTAKMAEHDGVKQGGDWFNAGALDRDGQQSISRCSGSKSSARKAASARIAMIPRALAEHIGRVYYPQGEGLRA